MPRIRPKRRADSADRLFYAFLQFAMLLLLIAVIYPLLYVLSSSFSSANAVTTGKVVLWPVEFSLRGYQEVFRYSSVWLGYRNTLFYTVVGTLINVSMTLFAAYGLSRPSLPGYRVLTFLFTFTMLFSGGLIPTYLQYRNLGIVNTPWVMLLPGAVSVYNMIVTRTFLTNLPAELSDAAQIDGCSLTKYFFLILLPLSKAVIAVIALYYAVGHWNAYFNAMMYLSDRELYPLQLFLREILILNTVDSSMLMDPEDAVMIEGMRDLLKYALIVVSTVPILCVYPLVQKYFAAGVMVGSVKG